MRLLTFRGSSIYCLLIVFLQLQLSCWSQAFSSLPLLRRPWRRLRMLHKRGGDRRIGTPHECNKVVVCRHRAIKFCHTCILLWVFRVCYEGWLEQGFVWFSMSYVPSWCSSLLFRFFQVPGVRVGVVVVFIRGGEVNCSLFPSIEHSPCIPFDL